MKETEITDTQRVRVTLLQQAQRILENKSQVDLAKSQGKSGHAPTTEQIIVEAEKLFKYVQGGK